MPGCPQCWGTEAGGCQVVRIVGEPRHGVGIRCCCETDWGLQIPEYSIGFWGKAQAHPASACRTHPLAAHALDVAAVALLLPHTGLGLDGRAIGWLVSLHDIGKFSRPFQAKAPEH